MTFTYVLSTDIGRVRMLVPDNKADYIFEDEEVEAFLLMEGHIKRAAAACLETIASNEVMVLKVIHLLDLWTDGAKVSDALLKRAALLRRQADDEELGDGGAWDIAELVYDDFTARERLMKQGLQGD